MRSLQLAIFYFLSGYFLLGVWVFFFACRPSRQVSKATFSTSANLGAPNLLDSLKKVHFQYQSIVLKGKGSWLFQKQRQSFSYRMIILKDSLLGLTISVMGIQALRFMVSKDSVKLVNYWEKTYSLWSFQEWIQKYGVSISLGQVQSLLLGDYALDFPSSAIVKFEGDTYWIQTLAPASSTQVWINASNYKLHSFIAKTDTFSAKIYYNNYQNNLPTLFKVELKGKALNLIQLEHQSIEINVSSLNFHFKIPENYVRK
ncbi:MAG: DUF4292 domain-containing protein [Bacteroidia bacterium]|nr:DUF4292 domain-containing protein [Bacteroidia bacterium]MDW8157627.1 DUF4292 domain-containing protein [Bacteroidia bacterium]